MLMAIDVGNTNIVVGAYDGERMLTHWRIATNKQKTSDELGILIIQLFNHAQIDPGAVNAIVISSVVPPLNHTLEAMSYKFWHLRPTLVSAELDLGVPIKYDNPWELGADRIVNAVAAKQLYGAPCIVVDFGTATTLDVVSAQGEYLGGSIAPGISISTEALFKRAARLYKVEIRRPNRVIGSTTSDALQSGIFWGFVGQVEKLIERTQMELGQQAFVVATGGLAGLIAPECKGVHKVEPFLTLEGLRIIHERLTNAH
ncbi:MAG TPA: type III pantothenate kinase [Firmicutes bacterium]|nr:type III pantothenate kinase [Bacillota bacterium]